MIYRVITGALFISAAIGKGIFFNTFVNEIIYYRILPGGTETVAALLILAAEIFIGTLLLAGKLKTLRISGGIILLLIIMAAKTSVIMRGLDLTHCHCFGTLLSLPIWASYVTGFAMAIMLLLSSREKVTDSKFSWRRAACALRW